MTFQKVYSKVESSVVKVVCIDERNSPVEFGTASLIGDGRFALTCAHCIPNISGVRPGIYKEDKNKLLVCRVVFRDDINDVAIIEYVSPMGKPIIFASSNACSVGEQAFVIGYPMGVGRKSLSSAFISNIHDDLILVDSSINHGNSGGPLFNINGECMGIISRKNALYPKELMDLERYKADVGIIIGEINHFETVNHILKTMRIHITTGLGFAISNNILKVLHPILAMAIK
ncbi:MULTISPECIES: serine protease [Klebsiella]|uniref:S1 family peptidase n=1 Tax=Klebsiella pneumoniae complex TaxID=3390273 RepID=UPI000A271EE3|nr:MULTISPECIES: serine protease [Klebsiella]HAH1859808.1 hypothetical protein [Escherichia coli]EKT9415031.1 trypsin-like peptidase domain-containing protein [Klebsiella pneumoniae]EKW6102390.1 trypsin-like peptidase domain-containing protein [Klebsiella pneumoniae]EKY0471457.1 trypsin-like peptidase domain-containing protein [Klebsiella pneumoniae]MBZ1709562.1 trypsin-like peptidase domain-containing protein [Klebsiella pneumoniae]